MLNYVFPINSFAYFNFLFTFLVSTSFFLSHCNGESNRSNDKRVLTYFSCFLLFQEQTFNNSLFINSLSFFLKYLKKKRVGLRFYVYTLSNSSFIFLKDRIIKNNIFKRKNFIRKSYFSISQNSEEVIRFACLRFSWLKRTVNFTIISSYFMHCTITCRGYCKRQLTDIASRRKLSWPLIFHRLAFAAVVTFERFSYKIGKDR